MVFLSAFFFGPVVYPRSLDFEERSDRMLHGSVEEQLNNLHVITGNNSKCLSQLDPIWVVNPPLTSVSSYRSRFSLSFKMKNRVLIKSIVKMGAMMGGSKYMG